MFGQKSSEELMSVESLKQEKLRQFWDQLNYISPTLGLNYMPSPLLKYRYPLATRQIVSKIADTLLSHPRFYTQVLHLMNKMNLPVPFGDHIQTPLVLDSNVNHFDNKTISSDSESELESTPTEGIPMFVTEPNKQRKRVVRKLKTGFVGEKASNKRPKLETKVSDNNKNSEQNKQIDCVFEVSGASKILPNIEFNIASIAINSNLMNNTCANELVPETSGFGLITPQKRDKNTNFEEMKAFDRNDIISETELTSNLLHENQWSSYPVFKGYKPGMTSIRLYIKNIDKKVEKKDLMRIYGKYIDWDSELHLNMFDIQLMKSGRMKGQAFITLPNESIAQKALNETNGYLFNGKPLVVAFARSARPLPNDQ